MKRVGWLFVLGIVVLAACVRKDMGTELMYVDVESALKLSGENRGELQKVLDYFSKGHPDTLKLRAAEYLISNMVGWHSIGGKTMDRLKRDIDTTFRQEAGAVRQLFYLIAVRIATAHGDNTVKYDLHEVTSAYLIRHIEQSFALWEDMKCRYDLPFEDFLKYLLPYRIDNEPITEWRDSVYYHRYRFAKEKNIWLGLSDYQDYIQAKISNYYGYWEMLKRLSDTLFRGYKIDCIDQANNVQIMSRLFGVPVATDFVPHYPARENRHYWTVLKDRRYANGSHYKTIIPYTAKVYRKTSYVHAIPDDRVNHVPRSMRNPYQEDVTEEYENVAELQYRFEEIPRNVKYAYLCVFNNQAWKEVAWTDMQGGKAVFEKIGRDIVYLPCYYDGSRQVFADYPQWLKSDGVAEELKPDTLHRQTLHLNRKFTYNIDGDYNGIAILGVRLSATNDLSKQPYDAVGVISHYNYMNYDTLHVTTEKKYRYWILGKVRNSYPVFASVHFLQQDTIELKPLTTFSVDGTGKVTKDTRDSRRIFNDELLDYGAMMPMVGVEFEKPVSVDVVKYITKNDKNGIYPGHLYELFYFNRGKWESLGKKVATADYIEYDNVPSGALYWLRNHTEGKEERPFTVNNGRVRFW